MSSFRHLAVAVLLCAGLACRPPQPVPWEQRLAQAPKASDPALDLEQRKTYEDGFKVGARMVHAALQWNERPFRLVLGASGSGEFRPAGTAAAASAAQLEQARVELDPATGLIRWALAPGDPHSQGMVAGFEWGLAEEGAPLLRPRAIPSPPANWTAWPEGAEAIGLREGEEHVQLRCAGGILAWQRSSRGFAGRRGWRSWWEPGRPIWVALSGGTLWIGNAARQAMALDLETGAIVAVGEAPEPPQKATRQDGESIRRQLDELRMDTGRLQRVMQLTERARQGEVAAMVALARELRGFDAAGNREAHGWFLKAAEAGHAEAMVEVATNCFHGHGRAVDREEARRWLLRAEQAGSPIAREVRTLLFEVLPGR